MNTFGPSASQQYPLIDPRSIREDRRRFRREALPLLERANSFYCPSGCRPCRGYILLDRYSYSKLNLYYTNFQLNIGDSEADGNVGTIKGISIVTAQCVSRGIASDPSAIYLVELTDARGLVCAPTFQFPTNSQYNIRAPAYSDSGTQASRYYATSLNSGVAWTLAGMVGDLWNQMIGILGAFPGLPSYSSVVSPEGFAFPGVGAWESLCRILDLHGMAVAADLTLDAPYSIVLLGANDTVFAALQELYADSLEEDLEHIDTGAGRVPARVLVYFHTRAQYLGTEETVRRDIYQWQSVPLYSVTVSAPAQFGAAVGTGYVWSDYTVRLDVDGNPVPADVLAAGNVAAAIAGRYYARIYRGTVGGLMQRYAGALPFTTGRLVDSVEWHQDYRNGWAGWATTIRRGMDCDE